MPSTVFTWVVERRLSWLLQLGCALISLRFLG